MHAAPAAPHSVRAEPTVRTPSDALMARWRRGGEAALWLALVLVVVGLSLSDSLLANVVPYERDTVVFYYPLLNWLAQQLHQGVFPLWTPQFFGGYPIFADGEIGLAYPPVLLAVLLLPPDRAFVALRLMHLSIAALGMVFLARTWRLPYASAALAGLVFALGNFLQAQIHHENIVRTASWLPLVLALVDRALRSRAWWVQLRWSALAAVALAMAGLGLHSQMLAIDLLVLAAYAVFRWIVGPLAVTPAARPFLSRLWAVGRVCGPVVLVGLALAAVQLVPLVELAGFSRRGGGIPYSESAAYSLTPFGLAQVVFPYVFRGQSNQQWGLWTHWESYLYIGLAPLALLIVALVCVRSREVAGWSVIGGLGLLLGLGQYSPINLHYLLWLLPGLSGLRAPGRFSMVVVLAGAMLAAYGMAWLMDRSHSQARARWALIGLTLGVGGVALGTLGLHAAAVAWPVGMKQVIQDVYLSLPRDSYPLTQDDVLNGVLWSTDARNPRVAGALAGLVVVVASLWLWQRPKWAGWPGWPGLLIGLTAVDLLIFDWGVHPREALAAISAEPPAIQALERLAPTDAAPNRVLASPVLNQVAADRLAPLGSLQEANGYSSLQFIWHREYLDRVLYVDDGLLDLWGVRYVIDPSRFGTLSSYKDVSYLPRQALLQAPAGSGLSEQQFGLNLASPIQELRFVTALMGAVDVASGAPVAEVELRDATGQTVGTAELQAGRDTMDWAWDVPTVQPYIRHQQAEGAGTTTENAGPEPRTRTLSFANFVFETPVTASTIVVRAVPPVGEFVLYGGAAVGADGSIAQLFGKTKTRYRQVYVDDEMRVLENTAAFPRAFLVPRARVAPSLGSALNQMVHQPFQPDQEVMLADDTLTRTSEASLEPGGQGSARVTAYAADRVDVHTSASGDAWLVLSDTYYPGWAATVDGQSA
ncbi:MAG TPA: hypothetical protein VF937_08860, partial [Chloroflexota bacterium]